MIKYIPYKSFKTPFYDLRILMSYGCHIMFAIGARSIGKTFAAKNYVFNQFLHKGVKFAWLRDNDESRKNLAKDNGAKFFSDCKHMNLPDSFNGAIDGETITINGEKCGYLMPSSTFQNYKGNDFDDVSIIVFDEFIAERNRNNDAHRTWEIINMIFTIIRIRKNVKIIFLANALDRGDEMLKIFGFNVREFGIYLNREKDAILHYCDNSPAFNLARDDSIIAKIVKGTDYEDNLFNNKFADDEKMFFDKMPPKSKLLCILHNLDAAIRIYYSPDGNLYARKDFNDESYKHLRFVNDMDIVDTRHSLLPRPLLDALKEKFANKELFFETAFSKNLFLSIIKKR